MIVDCATCGHPHFDSDRACYIPCPAEQCRCPLAAGEAWTQDPLPPPGSAAAFNATGSPTGRITGDAAHTSVEAASKTPAFSHRALILAALIDNRLTGLTSIEAADFLPRTRQGHPQVSNRSASRLGELWEAGQAAIRREHGTCVLGECHPHEKPARIHHATEPCELHGRMITRDGAAVWQAL